MKVLYISYDGLTDPLGQSQILPYLQNLATYGYEFTILSFEKKGRFEKEAAIVKSITEAANIKWVPLTFTASPPILSKIYDRQRIWRTAIKLHKKNNFNLIHCRSYVAAEVGLGLKKKFGIKFLFDMRGFWADEKVDNGQWNLKQPLFKSIYNHYKKKEKEFLLQADGIVSLTAAAKDYLLQKPEYKHLSIEVIPCCADLKYFNYLNVTPTESAALKSSLSIPAGAKVITYLGSVGGWYMTKEMFAFFNELQKQQPEYVMLVLTKDDPEKVRSEAAEIGILQEKLFVTYSTRNQLPVFLSFTNCSIFFIRNTFSKTASSPTKHAELMGMGVPVICNDIGDTGKIIQATNTGILINNFTVQSFDAVVKNISAIEHIDKSYIRSCAKNIFDLEVGSERYLALYQKMLAPVSPSHSVYASH